MAIQTIPLGTSPTGAGGDVAREAFTKVNANFAYLDSVKVTAIAGKGLSTEDFTTLEKSKLASIASGATANDTDANLKNRANHTGVQSIATISGLQDELDAKLENITDYIEAGANVVITGSGTDSDPYVISATTGGGGSGTVTSVNGETPDEFGNVELELFSGDYDDLENKPTLSTVATSGDYNDLLNKPTLATVATTGDYDDLLNKPDIPVVHVTEAPIDGNQYARQNGGWSIVSGGGGGGGSSFSTPVTISASSYALSPSDTNKYLMLTNSNGCSITIPPDSEMAVPIGTEIYGVSTQDNTEFVAGSGVVIRAVSNNIPVEMLVNTVWVLKKEAINIWRVAGVDPNFEMDGSSLTDSSITNQKIADNTIGLGKLAVAPENTLVGRGAGSGNRSDLTAAQVRAILNVEDGATADMTKADIDALGINAATVNGFTVGKSVPSNAVFTDTTYTVGDGGLTQKNFTTTLFNKLNGIEANADVTDAVNVAAAGAVMDDDFTSNGLMRRDGSGDYSVIPDNSNAWDEAYSWGDHALAGYQEELVSGVNIKTVGGQSILGTGDISVAPTSSVNTWTAKQTFQVNVDSSIDTPSSTDFLTVENTDIDGAAAISFSRTGEYSVHFGLDSDNVLKVGGWSMGNVSYEIIHAGNIKKILRSNLEGTEFIEIDLYGGSGVIYGADLVDPWEDYYWNSNHYFMENYSSQDMTYHIWNNVVIGNNVGGAAKITFSRGVGTLTSIGIDTDNQLKVAGDIYDVDKAHLLYHAGVKATATEIRGADAVKPLVASDVYESNAPVTSTGAGSWSINLLSGTVFLRTLTGNSSLGNPTEAVVGKVGLIYVVQDGTGGHTLSFGSSYKHIGGSIPSIDTSPNAVNLFNYYVREEVSGVYTVDLNYMGVVS